MSKDSCVLSLRPFSVLKSISIFGFGPPYYKLVDIWSVSSVPSKVYTDYMLHYLSLVPCEVYVRGKREQLI